VVEACRQMQLDEKRLPTLVKYSLAASCIDTAMIVGQELKLGTDRIVPEFTFLDPRGIGDWDMSSRETTMPALWAMDNDEAGTDGLYALPPSSEDGTPHEVLADQAVRLRQILSILESQYSGDTILLVFPDGTGPALLSAMIAGIPYNRVHELEYHPGEIRFDVTMESTLKLWKQKQFVEGEAYNEILKQGRLALKELRATHDSGGTVTNLKDKRIEEERIIIENEYRKKQQQRIEAELQREAIRSKRQYDVVEARRGTDKPDIGTDTALGMAAIVGSGSAAWYFSSNSTRVSSTINATESDSSQLRPSTHQRTLERFNFSSNRGSLYSVQEVGTLNRNEISPEESLGKRSINARTVKPTFDPKEKARIAMEEYLNRDDGADDWLLSITQIINEENIDETNLIDAEPPRFDASERNDLPVVHVSNNSDQPFQ
jgi:broad specificity phosphatase PhoE